jgi:hypothetical protein
MNILRKILKSILWSTLHEIDQYTLEVEKAWGWRGHHSGPAPGLSEWNPDRSSHRGKVERIGSLSAFSQEGSRSTEVSSIPLSMAREYAFNFHFTEPLE